METKYLRVSQEMTGEALAAELGIEAGTPAMFLIAGADLAAFPDPGAVEGLLNAFAQAAIESGALVVDGGTYSGAMGMMDDTIGALDFKGEYLGFVPFGQVIENGEINSAILGPNHSRFVVVDGDEYGDELCPMYRFIAHMDSTAAAAGMLVNGGGGSLDEVEQAVDHGMPLVVVKGSGRLADELANVIESPPLDGTRDLADLAEKGKFIICELGDDPEKLKGILKELLAD